MISPVLKKSTLFAAIQICANRSTVSVPLSKTSLRWIRHPVRSSCSVEEDGLPAIILYGYSLTRSGSHAKEFLEGYHGYLETDGYQGYNSLPDIKRCSCWAHIRRYFIDAVPKGKQYDYSQPAVQGVQYCNRLFAVGRKNWLFSDSVEGANASAVVYTMVEMAKAHGLNIYGYLKFLLEHRPTKDMTDDQLAELAPWSEKLQSIKNRM